MTGNIWFWKLCASLGFILGVLWLTLTILKKYRSNDRSIHNWVKLLGAFNIGPKEKIILLQIKNKKLVVGATANSLQTLLVCEDEVLEVPTEFHETLVDLHRQKKPYNG